MSVKHLSTVAVAVIFGSCTFAAQANNGAGHNWMPKQPANTYWQTPNWSGFSTPQPNYNAPPANRRPPANYRAPSANRTAPPPPTGPYRGTPAPQANSYRGTPPPQANPNRGAPSPQYNQYRGAPGPRGPYNGPSAFNTPGYNPNYNRRRNNGWNNNKFWGRSGPGTWMNPNKRNWENSWDDMINSPSRMSDDMPGGWSAPEVTMPNPVDMGDQMQDNMEDLPDQIRDGNIGNDVSN